MTLPHMIYDFAWAACGLFGCFLVLNVFMRRPSSRPVIFLLLGIICLCWVFFAHGQAVLATYPDRSATVRTQPSFVPKPKIRKRRRNEFKVREHDLPFCGPNVPATKSCTFGSNTKLTIENPVKTPPPLRLRCTLVTGWSVDGSVDMVCTKADQ